MTELEQNKVAAGENPYKKLTVGQLKKLERVGPQIAEHIRAGEWELSQVTVQRNGAILQRDGFARCYWDTLTRTRQKQARAGDPAYALLLSIVEPDGEKGEGDDN